MAMNPSEAFSRRSNMYAGVLGRRSGERLERSSRNDDEELGTLCPGIRASPWMLARRPRCDGVETSSLKAERSSSDAGILRIRLGLAEDRSRFAYYPLSRIAWLRSAKEKLEGYICIRRLRHKWYNLLILCTLYVVLYSVGGPEYADTPLLGASCDTIMAG